MPSQQRDVKAKRRKRKKAKFPAFSPEDRAKLLKLKWSLSRA